MIDVYYGFRQREVEKRNVRFNYPKKIRNMVKTNSPLTGCMHHISQ